VKEVLGVMKASGASLSYQNKMKVIINRVFVFGIEYGLIPEMERSPVHGISLGRIEEKKPEILTIAEIRRLLQEARSLDHPWYPIWALALLTGMRNGELFALQWSDIDWENKMLSVNKSYNCRRKAVKSTKSGEYRSVPISADLLALLQDLKAQAGARQHVLPRVSRWANGDQARELRAFCIGIGLPPVRFHTLRACFATQLIRNGVPPIQIQKVCGWKDLDTMQCYIRMAGIEITGVTESLKVLPEADVMAKVVNLFTKEPV
jgi:integrase